MARKPKDPDETPETPETPPPAEDRDRELLRGGPGDPPADAPAEPPSDQPMRARVKIGKKEFEVDPGIAAAYEEREREYMRGIQMDRREKDELERFRRAAQPTPPQDAEPDFNTLLFENPTRALELRDARLKAELEAKYRSEQNFRAFWEQFYENNPDLKDEKFLVNAQFQSSWDTISDMKTPDAQEYLADGVRKEILRISRKAKTATGTVPSPTGRAVVEGATGDRPPAPPRPVDSDEEPASLSAAIKARARARRTARSA